MKKSFLILTVLMLVFVCQSHAVPISYSDFSNDYLESYGLSEGYLLASALDAIFQSAQDDQEALNQLMDHAKDLKGQALSRNDAKDQKIQEDIAAANAEGTELPYEPAVYDMVFYLLYQNSDESTSVLLPPAVLDDTESDTISNFNVWLAGNGINFNFIPDNNTTPVPEPSTMLLLCIGIVGLAGVGRKKLFKK